MAHKWVRVPEVAEHTHQSVSTIKRLTARGEIPHVKVGRSVLYSLDLVDEWLLSQRIGEHRELPRRRGRRIVQPVGGAA